MLTSKFIIFIFLSYINLSLCDEIPGPGQKVYKNQLRGAYDEQKNIFIHTIVHDEFKWIYSSILQNAKQKSGSNEIHVSILCVPEHSIVDNEKYIYNDNYVYHNREASIFKECWNYDIIIYNGIIAQSLSEVKKIYKLTNDQLVLNVVDKLKQTFPDINITKVDDKCCNHYSIIW